MDERYPGYDVLAKWRSPSFNETTRRVLTRRLHQVPERRFLSAEQWDLLEAIVAQLIPQPDRTQPIPITPFIDDLLAANRGEGFRRDGAPPLRTAWMTGLSGIEAEAGRRFGRAFAILPAADQDAVLTLVQRGEVDQTAWPGLSAQHFFNAVLLKTVAGVYYSHPTAWSEIGFGGPASPRGYVRLGFDRRDPWEARERR
jgi:hypothetical protein